MADEVDKGNFPDTKCGEIFGFAQALPDATKEVLGEEQAKDLAETLTSAYNEKQRMQGLADLQDVNSAAIKNAYVKKTKEASGKFRALAEVMNAG